jgi:hypothetical protein
LPSGEALTFYFYFEIARKAAMSGGIEMADYSAALCECGRCEERLTEIETALSFWQQRLYKATSDMLIVVYADLEAGDVDAAQDDVRTFLEFLGERFETGESLDFETEGHA